MFKNRAFQVKMVKDETSLTNDITVGSIDAINEMIVEIAKPLAMAVVSVIAAKTLSEIVLHTARIYIK